MSDSEKLKIVLETVFQTSAVDHLLEMDIEKLKDMIEQITIVDNDSVYLQNGTLIFRKL